MKAFLEIEHIDANRNVISLSKQISKSFVMAFPALLVRQFLMNTLIDAKDVGGATGSKKSNALESPLYCSSPGGRGAWVAPGCASGGGIVYSDNLGIVIGSGTAVEKPQDYKLATKIVHGDAAGELIHFGTVVSNLVINAAPTSTGTFDIQAIFKNESGGSIDVEEVGVYAMGEPASSTSPMDLFCILRDVISTVAVADEEYLRVKYTVQIST